MKTYKKDPEEKNNMIVEEPTVAYGDTHQDREVRRVIALMGMKGKISFAHINSENDFIEVIRDGISKEAMNHLMNTADISLGEMANIMHTTDRNLRRYGPTQKLPPEQSEGIVEMAKLYSRGEEVLGSIARFSEWMNTTLVPFGNKKPKEFLDTSIGVRMIMDELGRIQHGVLA